jgi:hypothetical protein
MEDIDKEVSNKLGEHSEEPPAGLFESVMFQREKELRHFRTKRLLLIAGATVLVAITAYILYKSVVDALVDATRQPDSYALSSENALVHLNLSQTTWPDYRNSAGNSSSSFYQISDDDYAGIHSTKSNTSSHSATEKSQPLRGKSSRAVSHPLTKPAQPSASASKAHSNNTSVNGGLRAFFSYRINNNGEVTLINESEAGENAQYTWHFGDGNTYEGTNTQYSYSKNGIYHTCLSVLDKQGRYDSYCTDIYVEHLPETRDIRGEVNLKNTVPDKAWVYLIKFDSARMTPFLIDSVRTDETGHFVFTNKPEGFYILRGALDNKSKHYNQYLPTFYGQTLGWNLASRFAIQKETPFHSNIHIDLIHLNDLGAGSGVITGSSASDHELLILYDDKGNPVGFTYSDTGGSFSFNDLPPGKYRVYNPTTGKFTSYTSYGPPLPSEQPVQPSTEGSNDGKSDSGAGGSLGLTTKDFTLTPNPCHTFTTVRFDNPELSRARVTVVNINTNTEVFAFTVKNPQLKQEVNIDVQYWAPGIYFVTIDKGNGNVMTSKLLKTE